MFVKLAALVLPLAFQCALASHGCSSTNSLRLYPNYGSYGIIQVCYGGIWRTVCDYSFGYEEAKVACNQLGLTGGCYYPSTFYYSWSYYMSNYYTCTGDESTLSECSLTSPPYYGYCDSAYYDSAGVYCSQSAQVGSDGCTQGEIRLTGGADSGEGRAEYCQENAWVPMCSLDYTTAGLICAQLGYTQYTWSSVFDDERYGITGINSYFDYMSCYSYYATLDQCSPQFKYQCSSYVCSTEYGMKCYNPGACEEGTMRLAGGQIEQEGRPEICLNGVWGSICGYGWSQLDGFMFCEDLGYTEPGTGPYISTNSEFGDGEYPIIYSYVYCYGYEKSFKDCSKTVYPNFFCPRSSVAGLRCYEDCTDGDIRLVGGTESEGTVEICYGQLWGLVAETGWDNVDAQVACHQLGYPTDTASAVYGTFYGKPNKAVHVSNVNCNGNEERIADCTKTSISLDEGKTTYKSANVAGIKCLPPPDPTCVDNINGVPTGSACVPGTARLFGGDTEIEGTLQYCYKGQWSPACSLNEAAASVLCKQLGYLEYTYAAIFTNGEFPSFLQHSYFNNITCSSHASESTLADCDIYEGDCLPICQNSNIGIRCFQPVPCDQGAVRLSDGFIDQEGRVEVCHDNVWGTICDDGWDNTDAHVICSQLGYDKLEPIAFSNSYFGAGDGPIIHSQMACGGWERDIDDCNKAEVLEFACSRDNVAGVLCGYDCVDGDVRLTNMEMATPGSVEGTLEVCYNKIWGLISESGWTTKDAKVACVELGYIGEGAIPIGNTDADKPNKPVLLGDVSCQGDEATLGDCSATVYSLQEGKDLLATVDIAGVTCLIPSNCDVPPTGGTECQVGATRLTGDDEPSKGNLEYCYNGYWSPTCTLSEIDASIACKEFGFANYTWASVFTDGRFSSDSGEVTSLLYSFNCTDAASTSRLVDCNLADNCTRVCDNPIGIQCYDQQQCEEGTVRLTGGAIAQEGRLEVCINGVWGSICSSGWDNTDAFVTCKQLGYGDAEPISYTNSEFGEGMGPIVFSNLGCDGWEKNIVQCYWSEYGSFSCSRDELVGVMCHDECKDGQIRLVGGSTDVEGTIEICFDSLWGAISATTWTDANTRVTCKQLGYTGGSSVPGSQYGKPNVAVHLSSVNCQGSEDQLTDCELYPVDLEDGKELGVHVAFAGVACTPPETEPPTTTTDKTMGPTDSSSTTAEVGAVSSTSSDSLVFVVAGVLVVLIVIILVVLIIAVVVFMIKLRKGRTPTQNGFQIGPNQSNAFNIQSEAVNPLAGLDDQDMAD